MIFWGLTLLLVLLAVLFTVLPLLSKGYKQRQSDESVAEQHRSANLASFQDQQADIELRVAAGTLDQKEADTLTLELEKKLLAELPDDSPQQSDVSSPAGVRLALFLAVLIPVVALATYSQLGAQAEIEVTRVLADQNAAPEQVAATIEDWANEKPDNIQALYLLGSQYLSMGQVDEAVRVYQKLYAISGQHPQVSAQLAQVLFLAGDQTISDEVRRLYRESLAMEPDNSTALGLKGIDAFEKNRYSDAISAWQQALKTEVSPQARQAMTAGITKARMMMGEKFAHVTVRVDVAPELKSLPADTRVIIFARESGTRSAPVAAVPATVGELPREIILDDSSAMMMGGRSLSEISKLDIIARVTLSGDVMKSDYQAVVSGVSTADNELVKLEITPGG